MARTTATSSTGRPLAGVSSAAEKRSMMAHADTSHAHFLHPRSGRPPTRPYVVMVFPFIARPPEYGKFQTRTAESSVPGAFTDANRRLGSEQLKGFKM